MLVEDGAPVRLHLLMLLCVWNALKFVAMMPVSVALLMSARAA
ncbi:hypothetical protein [Propionibacterium sp. oral taxon 192]|nr:hypothetical protein [Propionibacterium sp. oral taxon 192]